MAEEVARALTEEELAVFIEQAPSGLVFSKLYPETDPSVLFKYASRLGPGMTYLEVGMGYGGSCILVALCTPPGVKIFTIEPSPNPKVERFFEHYGVKDRIEVLVGKSQDIFWDAPIDMLFIDGAHEYDAVVADFTKFGKWVVPGGPVLFHDYVAYKGPTLAIYQDVLEDERFETVEHKRFMYVVRRRLVEATIKRRFTGEGGVVKWPSDSTPG